MKTLLKFLISAGLMLLISQPNFAQAPTLGTAANFVLFSSNGAVSHTGLSQITGNVGTNNGSSTNFGNVNGNMHDQDPVSAQASTDLLAAYNQLAATTANFFLASPLGNNDTLIAGVYLLGAASTMNGVLTLDAENDPSAVFIIRVVGSLSTAANTKVNLINGGQACNVYWQIEGLLSVATGTVLRGTFIVNNAAIAMSTNDTIEGRLLTTTGGLAVDNIMAYTPIGCGSPVLTGPAAPNMGTAACFGVFSADGEVTNTGISFITGDVGTQVGSTTGFDALNITGTIHLVQDTTTAAAASALGVAYTSLNTLPHDIELMAPAAFGNNLVLTPHTYLLNAMTVFTDSLYLNAMGDSNAVFVIKINGALSTSTYAKVLLINAALAKNVYWAVNGAVEINDYTQFKGTVIANNGAVDAKIGVDVQGRLMSTTGAINTAAVTVVSPVVCPVVQAQVTILTEPQALSVCVNDTALFVVEASGSSLTYQWYKDNVALVNSTTVSGVTSDSLYIVLVGTTDVGLYHVIVTDGNTSDTSMSASLALLDSVLITHEPIAQVVCVGDSASFTVMAQGTVLTYQWFRGATPLVNSFFISGADSSTMTFVNAATANIDSNYYVVVNGICGLADTSDMVSLDVNTAVSIVNQPLDQIACVGDTIQLLVTTTGGTPSVQWYQGSNMLMNGTNVSGADSTVLTISGITTAANGNYFAIVTSACGQPDTSALGNVLVNQDVLISSQPVDLVACQGDSASFAVVAQGDNLSYQWFRGATALVNSFFILGADSSTLTFLSLAAGNVDSNYYVVVSGLCGTDTSAMGSLNMNVPVSIQTQPTDQIACLGDTVQFSLLTAGGNANVQWFKGSNALVNGVNVSGADSTVLTVYNTTYADTLASYYAVVNSSCGTAVNSAVVELTLDAPTQINTQPLAQTACEGDTVSLTVLATGTNLTYQWYKGTTALVNAAGISGVNTANLSFASVSLTDAGANYQVLVGGGCGPVDSSVVAAIVVNTSPSITTQASNLAACIGANATFNVVASGTALTYQWRRGTVNLANTASVSGVNTAALVLTGITMANAGINYNVLISGGCAPAVASANVSLTVNSPVAITTNPPLTQTVCAGSTVSFGVVATGAGLSYQWRKGTVNLTNAGNVAGATSATLTLNPVALADAGADYNVVIVGSCAPQQTSTNAALVVDAWPAITMQPINTTTCAGDAASFTTVATGTGLQYQWYKNGVALTNTGNTTGSNASTVVINPVGLSDEASYYVSVTGSCASPSTSNTVSLTMELPHLIVTQPADTITTIGGDASFTVVDNGQGLTYQWRRGSTPIVDSGNVGGSQTPTLQFSPATVSNNGMDYNVVITGNCAPDLRSINVALLVTEPLGVEAWLVKEAPVVFYPNPFSTRLHAMIDPSSAFLEADVVLYNSLGVVVMQSRITTESPLEEHLVLPAGIYHYRVIAETNLIQTGKLIAIR